MGKWGNGTFYPFPLFPRFPLCEENMAKFKVLTPVEHNETHYWPEQDKAPKESPSFGHGQAIPVDASGVIELSDEHAKPLLVGGAIVPLKVKVEKTDRK